MSTELKQLFHSPEDLSDGELDVLRVKLQNMRRIPRIAACFGFAGAAFVEGIVMRRKPTILMMGAGTVAGYAFGGYGASTINSNILSRKFDLEVMHAYEKRQLRRTMNLAGYGQTYIDANAAGGNFSHDKPY